MMSDEVLLDFCRALVSTVRSGLTLSDAFDTLKKSSRHGRMIARAAELTNRGAFLHEAFAAQGIFPPVFLALLRAGEEGGQIDDFLELYADCLEVRVKFRRQIERMLVYPLFVIVLAGALFLLVSFKVVPLVMEPLMKSGASLPPQAFYSAPSPRLWPRTGISSWSSGPSRCSRSAGCSARGPGAKRAGSPGTGCLYSGSLPSKAGFIIFTPP